MYWSPRLTTSVSAREPQMRHVLRVTRMGEKDSDDIGAKANWVGGVKQLQISGAREWGKENDGYKPLG